jgi:hypothetical protein
MARRMIAISLFVQIFNGGFFVTLDQCRYTLVVAFLPNSKNRAAGIDAFLNVPGDASVFELVMHCFSTELTLLDHFSLFRESLFE